MKAIKHGDGWLIVRGQRQQQYFSFFVDQFGSSWTRHTFAARVYKSKPVADRTIDDLRQRAKRKRMDL